jgi:hypothetical protein
MPPLPPSPARLRGRGHPVGRSLKISSTSAGNDKLVISIEDAGPGLDPSIAGRVFEPLFTIKENGMGLGLAICAPSSRPIADGFRRDPPIRAEPPLSSLSRLRSVEVVAAAAASLEASLFGLDS